MVIQADLDSLLLSLFERAVLAVTRRELSQAERDSISIAVVNSLGESALRQVRGHPNRRTKRKSRTQTQLWRITTKDRFYDDNISRSDFLESIMFSSGFTPVLTELALFLIEYQLDTLLDRLGTVSISGIGRISTDRGMGRSLELSESIYANIEQILAIEPKERAWSQSRLFTFLINKSRRKFIDENSIEKIKGALKVLVERKSAPYSIELSENIAIGEEYEAFVITDNVIQTEQNRIEVRPAKEIYV